MSNENNDTSAAPVLTAEQQIKLEEVRTERLRLEAELLDRKQEADRIQRDTAEVVKQQSWKQAIAGTQIKFYANPDDLLRLMGDRVQFGPDGKAVGGVLALTDAIVKFATEEQPSVADQRTTPRTAPATPASKAEMSLQDKVKFVQDFGPEAYEKLPLRPLPPAGTVPRSIEEFRALPISKKTELVGKYGLEYVESLPSTARAELAARKLRGGF